MNKKITIEYCKKLAAKNNGYFLNNKYINSRTKYLWKCEKNHIWEARYDQIKSGHWCGICAKTKITTKNCHELAKSRDGYFISNQFINSKIKYIWQCKEGHRWQTKYHKILIGQWCPFCVGARSSIDKCRKLAASKGGKIISTSYINSRTKYIWECKNGHQWKTTYKSILEGHWCAECNKLSITDYHNLAKKNNGRFIDNKQPQNNRDKCLWECHVGHCWYARYDNIQSGKWCPECAQNKFVSLGETEWLDYLEIPNKNRNRFLFFDDLCLNVDGYYNDTVYQFHGDYWHGNPKVFDSNAKNLHLNKTFGELYNKTLYKDNIIKSSGTKLVIMWEYDWKKSGNKDR